MDIPGLRRKSTLPLDSPETSPRKILKAKRRLSRPPTKTKLVHLGRSSITDSPLPLKKKASVTRETDDVSTAVVSLDSGSHLGKTGVLDEKDIGSDVDVTVIKSASAFSKTGSAVVTSLKKTLSGNAKLSKSLSRKESSVAPVPMPPGGLVEIAFSFDTTGSMSAALNEVKGRIKDIVQKLQSDVPGIRIAIFAHGDYCDKDKYIVKWIDFGATIPELHDFVNSCQDTWGGDGPECYELVLRRAQEVLSWTPGSRRSLVIIGDDVPHEPGYRYDDFTNDINWRDECTKLANIGVRLYGVAVRANDTSQKFYEEIAKRTGGLMITLDKFDLIFELVMAICYREGGEELLNAYQEELKDKYGVAKLKKNLSGMFAGLAAASTPAPFTFGLIPAKVKPKKATKIVKLKTIKPPKSKSKLVTKPDGKGKKKPKKEAAEREKMNDKKFRKSKLLNRLQWSPWKLAMCNHSSKKNTKYYKWLNGFIVKQIFTKDTDKAAVFEFGIQPPTMKKKYPVGFKVVDKQPLPTSWFGKLVNRKDVKERLKQGMAQGASVYVRRALFRKRNKKFMEKVQKQLTKSNYAFGTSKKNSRTLKLRKGFSI